MFKSKVVLFAVFCTLIISCTNSWASHITQVAAGKYHSVALKEYDASNMSGTVWTWGNNEYGQLGDGTRGYGNHSTTPVQVISVHDYDDYPYLGPVDAIAAGDFHTMAMFAMYYSGDWYAWGLDNYGQCAKGGGGVRPALMEVAYGKMVAGYAHDVFVNYNSEVYCCGWDEYGQIGYGNALYQDHFVDIRLYYIRTAAAGYGHSAAISNNYTLYAWGYNAFGQLGNGNTTNTDLPTVIMIDSDFKALGAGYGHTVALKNNGTVWAWGKNTNGQIGDGTTSNRYTPTQVPGITDVIAIDAGDDFTIALKNDGTVWAWGCNSNGQLGDGTTTDRYTPVQVVGLSEVSAITAGGCHTVALKSNGTVWTWGANAYGQLGDGTTTDRYYPTIVSGLDTIPPTGSITINNGDSCTAYPSVSLSIYAEDEGNGNPIDDIRISNDGVFDTEPWEPFALYVDDNPVLCTLSWDLLPGDGTKTVYAELRDHTGNITTVSDSIILDTTGPDSRIGINSDDFSTSSMDVSITTSVTDATTSVASMRFSNDNVSWSNWESYKTYKSWTLLPGDGLKTVYAHFSDQVGNTCVVADSIILDTVGPVGSIVINDGDASTGYAHVTLTLAATDASSVTQMCFKDEHSYYWTDWEPFSARRTVDVGSFQEMKTVYVKFKDTLGNVSDIYSDSIYLDVTPPTGSVTINNGDTATASVNVTLAISATDNYSPIESMRFSNNGTSWSTFEDFAGSKEWTLATGDGTKTVYVQLRDSVGNTSTSITDTIVLDTTGPTGSMHTDSPYTSSTSIYLWPSATDALSSVAGMHFSNDGTTWSEWEALTTYVLWTLTEGEGTKTVYAQFKDSLGNISDTISITAILDLTGPTGSITINDGAWGTESTRVKLTFNATDTLSPLRSARFSNDSVSWGMWESCPQGYDVYWTLTDGDGTKTVYAQFKDYAGNISDAVSDTIVLDTSYPVINSVTVSPSMAAAGDPLLVTVDATDTVGVDSVCANNILLTKTGETTWSGEIPAASQLGSHTVTVWARDRLGSGIYYHQTTDTSASYITTSILLIGGRGVSDPIMASASGKWLFAVAGRITIVDSGSFDLDNGVNAPIRVIAPGYSGIANGDFVLARGILNTSASPVTLTCNPVHIIKYD